MTRPPAPCPPAGPWAGERVAAEERVVTRGEGATRRLGVAPPLPVVLAAAAGLGAAVLLLALVLAGGGPQPPVPGLPDAGPLTGWGLPVTRFAFEVAAVGTVGVLLTGGFLVPSPRGRLEGPAVHAVRAGRWWAAAWLATALASLVLSVSDTLGVPLSGLREAPWPEQLRTGRSVALLSVAAAVAVVAVAAGRVRTTRSALLLLLLATSALLPTTVTGHSSTAGDHDLAVTSLAVHVVAASLWVGGLLGVVVHLRSASGVLAAAVPRFSAVALAAFAVLGMSGLLAATSRIGTTGDSWTSAYGALVLGKAAALVGLGVLGWQHRHRTLPRIAAGRRRAFLRLAGVEIAVMAAAIGLAVALSRTPLPAPAVPVDAPDHGVGHETLATDIAPVTLGRLLTEWRPDALVVAAVGLALAAYLAGVRRLAARGEAWSRWRTAAGVAGLVVALFALDGGLATYAPAMVSAQLAQFLLVALAVPALLVLAAPVALWTLAHGLPPTAERALVALSDPFRGLLAFAGLLFALYRTPLVELSLRSFAVHLLVSVAALAAGFALLWPVLAVDPVPRPRGVAERVGSLAGVVGLLLLLAAQLRYGDQLLAGRWFLELRWPWVDPVDDQRLGAVVVAVAALAVMPLLAVAAAAQPGAPGGARAAAHGAVAAAATRGARPAPPRSRTARGGSRPPRPSRERSPRRGSPRRP